MNAKTTTVTLVANGVTREFEFSHAERLLRMPRNGGWELPKNSNYEFVNDGLRRRGNKKKDNGK
jgi:hypothetical protein